MTDQDNTAPAVWDPTARGGAGGWVRRKPAQDQPGAPAPSTAPGASAHQTPYGFPPPPGAPAQPGIPAQPGAPVQPNGQAQPGAGVPQPPPGTFSAYGFAAPQDAPTAKLPPVPPLPPTAGSPTGAPFTPPPPGSQPGTHSGAGAVGDEGPPLGARPYLGAATPPSGFGAPATPPPGFPPPPAQAAFPPPPGAAPAQSAFPPAQSAFPPPPGTAPAQSAFPPAQSAFPPPPGTASGLVPGPGPVPVPGGGFPPSAEYEELAPYEEDRPRGRTPLFVAVGVVLAITVGVGAFWLLDGSGDGSKSQAQPAPAASAPAPAASQPASAGTDPSASGASSSASPSASASDGEGPNAAAQAKTLDDLLGRGEGAKAPIGNAVAKVNSCPSKSEIDSAVKVFEDGAAQRDQLIADLAKLDLGQLPGGADAAQTLRSAWQQSGDIDRAYAAWARTVGSRGCSSGAAPDTDDLKRANDLNPQATRTKQDFVAKWNSMAGRYSLPTRTWDRI
ncbi:hypothetical protein [Kitasatospora sp. NPDC001175]|uniref:hypothetical protein n=1 Tax=Kitasatospora sp. NPDC001175 TaxID=3157103 RepID=UPI003CFD3E8B